jgi:cysteine-rich repeat protein
MVDYFTGWQSRMLHAVAKEAKMAMKTMEPTRLLGTLVASLCLWTGLGREPARVAAQVLDVEADSFLRSGADNTNEGANYNLVLRASGKNRALVRFDTTQLSGTVDSATLHLYIVHNADNWGTEGRDIGVYRIVDDWAEGDGANQKPANLTQAEFNVFKNRGDGDGVTWKCATDAEINNQSPDCDPKWNGGTFATTPTDTVTIFKFMTGVEIQFDVTPDVLFCVNEGASTCSWMVKKVVDGQPGWVEFASKEGAANRYGDVAPRLDVASSVTPLCGNGVIDGTEECDDGNTVDGDGCSALCTDEPPNVRCPCDYLGIIGTACAATLDECKSSDGVSLCLVDGLTTICESPGIWNGAAISILSVFPGECRITGQLECAQFQVNIMRFTEPGQYEKCFTDLQSLAEASTIECTLPQP